MTAAGDGFEADESVVLAWLLTKPEVAKAVDVSLMGRDDEALPAILQAVKGLLAEGSTDDVNKKAVVTASNAAAPAAGRVDPPHGANGAGVAGDVTAGGKRKAAEVHPESASLTTKKPRNNAGLARCVCVVMSGLPGCGKSALCNILREVLGGNLLSADEMSSKAKFGKNARQAFASEFRTRLLKGLASADRNRYERLIFVDRTNTVRSHRGDLIQTLKDLRWRLRGGTVLLVDFTHSADTFGYGVDGQLSKRYCEQHVAVCQKRIEDRGAAHHALHPSPKLRSVLHASAKAAEAPSAEELTAFDARVSLEVTRSPIDMAMEVIVELGRLQWLATLRAPGELRPRVEVAWQAYERAESQWREGAAVAVEPQPHRDWLSQCRQAQELEKARAGRAQAVHALEAQESAVQVAGPQHGQQSVPLYWKIDLPEVTKVLSQRGILPSNFVPVTDPHTTLLYLGGESDDARAAERAGVASVEQYVAMREALEALQGEEFEVKMTEIVIEENVACAIVGLPPIVPCANKVPHVTLGTMPGVGARHANEVLQEVRAGRREGITSIPLPTPRPLKGRVALQYSSS